jgi:hypothetical protein
MAFSASAISTNGLNRSQSIGPNKMQILNYSAASTDTSGTVTADALSVVYQVIVTGPAGHLTSAPSYSGNVVTLAFADPGATVYGQVICIGA